MTSLQRCCQVSVIWCQSLAFQRLGWKLRQAFQIDHSVEMDELHSRYSQRVLVLGLIVFNTLMVAFMVIVCWLQPQELIGHDLMDMEWASWSTGFAANLLLLISVLYSVKKLQNLYPSSDNAMTSETIKMTKIAVVFGFAFLVQTAYVITLYIYFSQQKF